jgi:hypothetical protein
MTLKEKFKQWLDTDPRLQIREVQLEVIAEEFAIGFAEWIRKEAYYEHLTKEFIYKRNVYASEKELLEIYKKEKRL